MWRVMLPCCWTTVGDGNGWTVGRSERHYLHSARSEMGARANHEQSLVWRFSSLKWVLMVRSSSVIHSPRKDGWNSMVMMGFSMGQIHRFWGRTSAVVFDFGGRDCRASSGPSRGTWINVSSSSDGHNNRIMSRYITILLQEDGDKCATY